MQCALRGGLRYLRIPLIRGICDAPVINRSVIFFVVVTTVTLVTVIGIYIMLPVTAVTTVTVGVNIDGQFILCFLFLSLSGCYFWRSLSLLPTEKENGINAVNRVKRDMSDDIFRKGKTISQHWLTRIQTVFDSENTGMYVWKNIGTKNAKNRENMHRPIFQRVKGTESLPPLMPLTSARNGRLCNGLWKISLNFQRSRFRL